MCHQIRCLAYFSEKFIILYVYIGHFNYIYFNTYVHWHISSQNMMLTRANPLKKRRALVKELPYAHNKCGAQDQVEVASLEGKNYHDTEDLATSSKVTKHADSEDEVTLSKQKPFATQKI